MIFDLKFVELTADVLEITFINFSTVVLLYSLRCRGSNENRRWEQLTLLLVGTEGHAS